MSRLHSKLSENTNVINQLRGGEQGLPDPSIEQITTDENTQDVLIAKQLDDEAKTLEQIRVKLAEMRMEHEKEEHALRKAHLTFLSKITIYWLGLITVVSLLQGFRGLGILDIHVQPEYLAYLPFYLSASKFELTNPAFIALITTTTATILGLYTIAAIWLYKGKHESKDQKDSKDDKGDSSE